MYLDFDGREVRVDVEDESTVRSRHTGTELRRVYVSVDTLDQKSHERLPGIIEKAIDNGINSTDGHGNVLNKWKIGNFQHSYIGRGPETEYHHHIELEEMEELKVESLVLDELQFFPYSYHEEFSGDDLIIEAKVLLSESQYTMLKELMKKKGYFPVVRHGISDETREMRFGVSLWSRHDDGIKHTLHLVEKSYDEDGELRRGIFQPEMSIMQDFIACHDEIIQEMLTSLIRKGILESEEADALRKRASERVCDKKRDFYSVEDIDEWI